jgi:hypothetical protein
MRPADGNVLTGPSMHGSDDAEPELTGASPKTFLISGIDRFLRYWAPTVQR